MTSFEFNTTRSIINEPGSIKRLGEICTRLGFERPPCSLADNLEIP